MIRRVLVSLARIIGAAFFAAAVGVYIYFHFFTSGEDCSPFGFLPILQLGCTSTMFIWLLVVLTAVPGIALFALTAPKDK
jgi:hypothetical protein